MEGNMKKVLDYLYIVFFLCILLIPLFLLNTKPYSVSELDNRRLTQAPEIGNKDFPTQFETYLKDRIGFRDDMITYYARFNDAVADDLTHPLYENGKDGYIFFSMSNNIEYGDYHRTFAEFVKQMQEYCEARGIHFYFAFEPEKTSVLRQYIPDGVNYDDSWVEEMFAYMDELGVNYIDNKALLIEKSKSEQVFNVKYDAGHWNDLGCFYATNNILSRIHEDFPEVTELSRDDFDISSEVARYLPVSRFEVNETVPKFKLKTNWSNVSPQYLDGLLINKSFPHFHYMISNSKNAKALPRLLTFQGSYYNGRPQYFVSRASEYIAIHNYQNVLDLDYYINAFDPQIIVFEVSEYTLTDSYFNSSNMKNPGWNPPLTDVRDDDSVEDQLSSALSSATLMDDLNLNVLRYDKLEKVYLYKDMIRSADYLYLLADDHIFDLRKDEYGFYSTMIPSVTNLTQAKLFVITSDGSERVYPLSVSEAQFLQEGLSTFSSGSHRIADPNIYYDELGELNNAIEMTTDIRGNNFNSVELQLYSLDGSQYFGNIYSTDSTGDKAPVFQMAKPTGWYCLRLKANSSKQDEFIDYIVHLEMEEYYAFSFKVDKLARTHIVISDFRVFGVSEWTTCSTSVLGDPVLSEQASIGNDTIVFSTDIEENRFSSAILSVLNDDDGDELFELFKCSEPGSYHGYYCHFDPSGEYCIKLRANSNLSDEWITFTCNLKQHALYEISFEIVKIEEREIIVNNLQIIQIAQ